MHADHCQLHICAHEELPTLHRQLLEKRCDVCCGAHNWVIVSCCLLFGEWLPSQRPSAGNKAIVGASLELAKLSHSQAPKPYLLHKPARRCTTALQHLHPHYSHDTNESIAPYKKEHKEGITLRSKSPLPVLDLFSTLFSPLLSPKRSSTPSAPLRPSCGHLRIRTIKKNFFSLSPAVKPIYENEHNQKYPGSSQQKSLDNPLNAPANFTASEMSPSIPQPHVIAQFRSLIWHALDNDQLHTALFTAERLQAYDPKSADSVHLHALCLYRDGQYQAAEVLTKSCCQHLGCAYVFAQCCLKLGGGRESHGITALENCKKLWSGSNSWNAHSDTERKALPDAAAVHNLLGKLWHSIGDTKGAVESYVAAVKANPFLWESFEGLCDTGATIRVNNIFKPSLEMLEALKMPENNIPNVEDLTKPSNSFHLRNPSENINSDPFAAISAQQNRERADLNYNMQPSFFSRLNESVSNVPDLDTPTQSSNSSGHDIGAGLNGISERPGVRRRPAETRAAAAELATKKLSSRSNHNTANEPRQPPSVQDNYAVPQPARRSTRLLSTTSKITSKLGVTGGAERETKLAAKEREREAKKATKAAGSRSRSVHLVAGLKEQREKEKGGVEDVNMIDVVEKVPHQTAIPSKPLIDTKQEDAQNMVLDLFRRLGSGYFWLKRYNCKEALQWFNSVVASQRETPWVQSRIGYTYYEMADYAEAEKTFVKVRQLDPVRITDMEVYSTVLWHQRKDVQLSHLAHELIELDRLAPQSWCALANCFSVQRDHEQALKCLKRAIQLDPKMAYAYTLQGHEHISNEEYEKALVSYRSAITANSRHYNAWYGLGRVYEKLGKYDTAEEHFRRAARINPTNPVLVCCIGTVLEKTRDYKGALAQYTAACQMAPKSALSRFRKARTLMSLQNYDAAMQELTVLKDLAPDEANVHFLLGRLHKHLRDKTAAIKHYTIALNLDPKAGQYIKEAIESLDDDEEGYPGEDSEVYRLLDN
ncbi:anaphase-promoting complex subunit cdc27 [Rhizina undulata]